MGQAMEPSAGSPAGIEISERWPVDSRRFFVGESGSVKRPLASPMNALSPSGVERQLMLGRSPAKQGSVPNLYETHDDSWWSAGVRCEFKFRAHSRGFVASDAGSGLCGSADDRMGFPVVEPYLASQPSGSQSSATRTRTTQGRAGITNTRHALPQPILGQHP